MINTIFSVLRAWMCAVTASLLIVLPATAADAPSAAKQDAATMEVIGAFKQAEVKESDVVKIGEQRKRLIMFVMGVPLLVMILITGALGIALGVYGKRVYIPHMICAGLSVTLAIAHAVVGIVWFYPF